MWFTRDSWNDSETNCLCTKMLGDMNKSRFHIRLCAIFANIKPYHWSFDVSTDYGFEIDILVEGLEPLLMGCPFIIRNDRSAIRYYK